MLSWFKKAQSKAEQISAKASSDKNDKIQGSYTDHHMSPYQMREQIEPMHGDELKAFHWVIDKMEKENKGMTRLDELIEAGFDAQWFVLGKQGELRVTEEAP